MEGSLLFVGLSFDQVPGVASLLSNPTLFPCVLAPGRGALDVGKAEGLEAFRLQAEGKTPVVFVLDGSWTGAAKILEHSPLLAALPRVSFTTGRTSRYGFKRQPRAECLSTLEAVHELVDLLERARLAEVTPANGHHALLAVFDALVSFQGAFSPQTE
jgi:DTW domain-containing protein YfiP